MSGIPTGQTAGTVTWEGDLVPPVTSYATTRAYQAPNVRLGIPASTNRTNSAVVMRRPRRNGLRYFYAHGGLLMPLNGVPTPGAGGVRVSAFQPWLVHLYDWITNSAWFAAGYPRNTGLTFRVPQLKTQVTGGSGPGAMDARPLFPRVQSVPRASAIVRRYPTRSSNA